VFRLLADVVTACFMFAFVRVRSWLPMKTVLCALL